MGGGRAFCLLLPLPGDIRQLVVVVHRAVLLTRSDITVPRAVYGGDYDSHSRSVIYTTALGIIHGGRRRGEDGRPSETGPVTQSLLSRSSGPGPRGLHPPPDPSRRID